MRVPCLRDLKDIFLHHKAPCDTVVVRSLHMLLWFHYEGEIRATFSQDGRGLNPLRIELELRRPAQTTKQKYTELFVT